LTTAFQKRRANFAFLGIALSLALCSPSAFAQQNVGGSRDLQPIDLTPPRLPVKDNEFSTMQNMRINALYKLPAKMFFNANVENSLRLETNAFQTRHNQRADMVYRVLPNTTLGYSFDQKTRVSANYFYFHDLYADHGSSLSRNVHSISLRGDRDFYLNPTTVLTTSIQNRELFITKNPALNDILPSVALSHRVGDNTVLYGSVLGQIRMRDFLGGRFQEGDQFYSLGSVYSNNKWIASADATLIDNFGKGKLRFGPDSNHIIVLTMEGGRRLSQTIPVVAFVRAQPIFNIGAANAGFAGFNMRLFGGLRFEVSKPSLFPRDLKSK
jgi:hypothetical protein